VDLGLPSDWETIETWLDPEVPGPIRIIPIEEPMILKNPELPELRDYSKAPGDVFWNIFPFHYPNCMGGKVDIGQLEYYVRQCWPDWTYAKRKRAKEALDRLDGIVPVALQKELPGISCRNAESAVGNGRFMTDAICSWVKKGFPLPRLCNVLY